MQHGLVVDGKVGPNTERSLRVALSPQPAALHPLPPITRRWRFDHAELAPFPYSDTQLEAVTGTGSWSAGAIRLVAGYDAARRTVNRGWDSFTTLDTFSIGIAHWWADTAPELLAEIARREPDLAAWAWGSKTAELLADEDWLPSRHPPQRGKKTLSADLHWLLSGWWACARHPSVARIQCEQWLHKYVGRARTAARQADWEQEISPGRMAADIGGPDPCGQFRPGLDPDPRRSEGTTAPWLRWKRFYLADRTAAQGLRQAGPLEQDHLVERVQRSGARPAVDLLQGLDFSVPVQRHDASPVVFPAGL
jgi:hypothetical protein